MAGAGAAEKDGPRDTAMMNGGAVEMVNGGGLREADGIKQEDGTQQVTPADTAERDPKADEGPGEILHITQGFIPLSLLLSRLAQVTHNDLQDKVLMLAKMALPAAPAASGTAVNGNTPNGAAAGAAVDDLSQANLTKKATLLNFAQEWHGKWVKALVITDWGRRSEEVGKLVDLKFHLDQQRRKFDDVLGALIEVKRGLAAARLPNPDLKTALQTLATGDVPWFPEFGYIDPPKMTPEEQLEWLDNLNTLLSMRLNVEDHDNIPYHFRNYSINDGRVTFIVENEFEVDLTIADEDFEKQFWFIDFRFLFTPAPADLTDVTRAFLEAKINDVLGKEGLQGCYRFLHEFVLTHKISEFIRQARNLSRNRWVDKLMVERLNRAMSIQYWIKKSSTGGPKSWIILGVHSGKTAGSASDPKATSRLALRWFRDNKEVENVSLDLDGPTVSAEDLLKRIIAKHTGYYLTTIYNKLRARPRYGKRQALLKIHISPTEPSESFVEMQLWQRECIQVRIDPVTGLFALCPSVRLPLAAENKLNYYSNPTKDVTDEAVEVLESLRSRVFSFEMDNRSRSLGWSTARSPLKPEEARALLNVRESGQFMWFRRQGWGLKWFLVAFFSLSGDRWWLIEV